MSTPANDLNDAFSQLDKLAGVGNETPDSTETPAPETPSGEAAPAKADPEPLKGGNQPNKLKAADLRTHYEQLKAKHAELEAKHKELEAKAAPDWDKHPEKIKLSERLTKLEQERATLDEELRFTNYQKSQEYKTQYEKPFFDAYASGVAKISALKATDPTTGEPRAATRGDFDALMRIQDDDAAADKAAELFGPKAPIVLYHRERCLELQGRAEGALETYKKEGLAREQARAEQMKLGQEQIVKTFHDEVKAAADKYPQWFKAPADDAQAAEVLERGMHLADVAFGKQDVDENGRPRTRTPAEMAKLNAAIRNKAGAFDLMVHQLNKERKKLAALEKELKQYKASEPGGGDGGRKPTAPQSTWDQVEASLRSHAR